jgi:hypothetical protein
VAVVPDPKFSEYKTMGLQLTCAKEILAKSRRMLRGKINVKFLFIKKVLEIKNDYKVKGLYSFALLQKKGCLEDLNRKKLVSFLRILTTKLIIKINYQNILSYFSR